MTGLYRETEKKKKNPGLPDQPLRESPPAEFFCGDCRVDPFDDNRLECYKDHKPYVWLLRKYS